MHHLVEPLRVPRASKHLVEPAGGDAAAACTIHGAAPGNLPKSLLHTVCRHCVGLPASCCTGNCTAGRWNAVAGAHHLHCGPDPECRGSEWHLGYRRVPLRGDGAHEDPVGDPKAAADTAEIHEREEPGGVSFQLHDVARNALGALPSAHRAADPENARSEEGDVLRHPELRRRLQFRCRNGLRAHDQREALRKLADFGRGGCEQLQVQAGRALEAGVG
mmetsp:Transcript_70588/g.98129  ORF Transcript_70588/g.98129 Transcript_70588/m.98129 type:complete len:219 (-) Transcript_70588:860-1516(-)